MKISKTDSAFDLVFIGLGCANSLLLFALHRQNKLKNLRIGIVEPDSKTRNDRTFCFWATDEEIKRYDLGHFISKSWDSCVAGNREAQSIAPFRYHHISGLDLYVKTAELLETIPHTRIADSVISAITENGEFIIQCEQSVIRGRKVFDSRPPKFNKPKGIETHLLQSFYGWKIESANPVFNPNEFVMMDFSIPQNGSTQFVYVLPYSDKTALVECTRFGREMIGQDEAETILNQYITLRWGKYKITETETGVIPMSSSSTVSKAVEENWILTGARAGNIKPSTGYSFFKSCKDAERLSHNEKPLNAPGRYAFYDRLLLHILGSSPGKGKVIFERLFTNISAKTVLDFLREDVKPGKEVQILGSLPKGIFIKTAFLDFLNKLLNPVFIPLGMALLLLLLNFSGLEWIGSAILLLGLLLLGLPHGAIDHLLETGKLNTPVQPAFIVKYLSLAAGMGFVWWLSPWLGLMVFLAYSAWHFGETEMQSSGDQNNLMGMLWGMCLLGFLLLSHPADLRTILAEMGLESIAWPPESIQWVAFTGLLILGWLRGLMIFTASFYLLLAIKLPLLQAFGVYFIFDHSIKSSQQLLLGFNSNWKKLYPKAMPFTAGAILMGLLFYSFNVWNEGGGAGLFFIFLSCLSFPHVIAMNGFYKIR